MRMVPLERAFVPVHEAYQKEDIALDELGSSLERGERKHWSDLLDEFRVVILANAGAGKTHELKAKAAQLFAEGKHAFFIRIEDIRGEFGTAIEVGSPGAFEAWLASSDEAWFFLDSVDELRLTEHRAFEDAMRAFATRIASGRQRAHVYISSRPYAWRSALDRAMIEELLPFAPQEEEEVGDDNLPDADPGEYRLVDDDDGADAPEQPDTLPGSQLRLYILAPLDEADVRLFARHNGVTEVASFIDALNRGKLMQIARLPFDLQDLIQAWLADPEALTSRLAVLDGSIKRQIAAVSEGGAGLSPERALAAAQLLAFAVTMSGKPNIALQGTARETAIDPAILLPDWTAEQIRSLLTTGVFGDPIFDEVRFRHRETRELLAAGWISSQLARKGGRAQVEMQLFRQQFGEDILPPRIRVILPWLVLFDAEIRDRVLKAHPEIAVEGGDAAMLPPDIRRGMLTTMVEQILDPVSARHGLDNSEIARIAQSDLEAHVLSLIAAHEANDDVIFLLGRLVWQGRMTGCIPSLMAIAKDPARGIYARLASIRAVASVGSPQQLGDVWGDINRNPIAIPRRVLAEIASNAPPSAESVDLFITSIDRLEPRGEYEVTGLTQALHGFIEELPEPAPDDSAPLVFRLAEGLLGYLKREPFVERGDCQISEAYRWLMSPALHCIEKLVAARSPAALSDTALAILAGAPALRFWSGDDYNERKSRVDELVPEWPEMNDRLFWWTIDSQRRVAEAKNERLTDDWPASWMGHSWGFAADSFERTLAWIGTRELADDRLVALSRTVRTYKDNDRPKEWLAKLRAEVKGNAELEGALKALLDPKLTPQARRYRNYERERKRKDRNRKDKRARDRAAFVERTTAAPEDIVNPPGLAPGQFSNVQYYLLRIVEGTDMRRSRAQGSSWKSLVPEFGMAVAEAYRDAALAFWRNYRPPLRSEGGNTSQIPYALIFAMAGIDIEFGAEGFDPASLDTASAKRALRFLTWELNGFPRWFERLYRAKPRLAKAAVWKEAEWELANSSAEASIHYIVHDIAYYAEWLHPEIAPLIYDWALQHQIANDDCLRYCIRILRSGGIPAADIATLARGKIEAADTPAHQLALWYAVYTDADPAKSVPELKRSLAARTPADAEAFGTGFTAALLGDRRDSGPLFGLFKTPTHLKELYVLAHQAVRVADDIDRNGKGVYSPTERDDAQSARERLFGLLTEILGGLANQAIRSLAEDHPEPSYRPYMQSRAVRHAVDNGDQPAWSTAQIAEFSQRLAALPLIASPKDDDAAS